MKINKWTRALLATGVVGMGAVAQAEEAPASQVLTAVSGTQLSGYVSTTASWAPNSMTPAGVSFGPTADGFDLDVIDLVISKPLDEGEWSAGFNVELWAGPNAGGLGNNIGSGISDPDGSVTAAAPALSGDETLGSNDLAIKQANVQLNAPIGNGVVFTMGVFDTIIGYEVANNPDNPNYTRSYGFTTEPFQHLGILASYQLCEEASISAGIADSNNTILNPQNRGGNISAKTYMAALNVTAPESFGPLGGAAITAGVVDGRAGGAVGGPDLTQFYLGGTIPTPVENVTLGFAWDHVNIDGNTDTDVIAAYVGYGLSENASLNLRLDYIDQGGAGGPFANGSEWLGTTATLDYALWENVLTRAEWRYDKNLDGSAAAGLRNNNHLFALNVVYQF